MTDLGSLLAAHASFYEAFGRRDLAAVLAAWSGEPGDICIHPGWDICRGPRVAESWRRILADDPATRAYVLEDVSAEILTTVGRVIAIERSGGPAGHGQGRVAATSLFVRRRGAWRLVLHHGSAIVVSEGPRREGMVH